MIAQKAELSTTFINMNYINTYMPTIMDTIKKRRSIRKYLDIPLEWDKIVAMLEAGRYAPSAGNLQHKKMIVVTEKDGKRAVAEACLKQYWIEKASALIVITSLTEKPEQLYGDRGRDLYAIEDCAMAAQNIVLIAQEMGVATCCVAAFDEEMLKDSLSIPTRAKPMMIIVAGYADEQVPEPPRETLESSTFFQRYANRVGNVNAVLWDVSLMNEELVKSVAAGVKKQSGKLHETIKRHAKNVHETIKKKLKKEDQSPYDRTETYK